MHRFCNGIEKSDNIVDHHDVGGGGGDGSGVTAAVAAT